MAIEKSKSTTLTSSNSTRYTLGSYFKENSTSTPNNTSNITCSATLTPQNGYWSTSYNSTLEIYWFDDNENSNGRLVASISFAGLSSSSDVKSCSGTINVTHKSNGTLNGYAKAVFTKGSTTSAWAPSSGNVSTDNTALTTIPRYTSITTFTVGKRNETSFTFNWATADTIDYVWYSTDNGSNWTGYDVTDGTSGNFTVSGLSPNTTYNCKLRVRRKDSQLTTDSSTVSQTTYKAPSQSLSSKTETSITMSWSCDSTANHIWYSKDNGANWVDVGNVNATSGSYTISGLTANTSYNIKTRVRRSATNTTYDTSASSQTTYAYPYCTEAPNFTIGNNVTIKLYNPLNRTVQIQMWSHVGSQFVSDLITVTGTSYTGFSNVASRLYASIPNNTSSRYNIDVWYNSNKAIKEGGSYSIIGTEIPTFNNFAYKDSNSIVSGVTGNDQVMVKGLSTVQVTISSANKMVANNSATPSNYALNMSNLNGNANYSTSDVTVNLGTINASGTQRLNVIAYDSRGLNKTVYKDITVYDYIKPVINTTITRLNNFEAETTIKVNGTYTKLAINNVNKNSITSVQYRYRETGGTWSSWVNLTTTVNNGNFTCADVIISLDITKSFEFEIRATDTLQQTTTLPASVDIGQAIFFVSTNNRTCYINNKEVLTNNYTGNATITGTVNVVGTLQINGQNVLEYDVVDTW